MDWLKNKTDVLVTAFRDSPIWSSLAVVGACVLVRHTLCALNSVWKYLLRPGKDLYKTYGGPNTWAIVTGGSSGIGLAYAKLLAKAGFNLILIARNPEKLEEKKQEILKEKVPASCAIETVCFDFCKPYTPESYQPIVQALNGKEIAILVNNVGADHACEFYEYTPEALSEMINVNVNATTFLTWIVIPQMMKRAVRRSAVINISSCFTEAYMPNFNVYIATKAYINALMRCLYEELKKEKIDVLTTLTGEVSTPRNPMKSMWHASADSVAHGQVSALGKEAETYGGFRHLFYTRYLQSCISGRFKKWLGTTARSLTLASIKKA